MTNDQLNIAELQKLAEAVKGWSNCNKAWLDSSEDVSAATVGHIDEEGNDFPVAVIDCDQYYQAQDSLKLAKFYAAANPKAVLSLVERIKELEHRQPIKLGVVEFHTPKNPELIRQFYEVTNDLKMAGCIVDLWLLDIATVLKRHGYSMEIYKDAATNQGGQQNG